jgi:hypothetical protein
MSDMTIGMSELVNIGKISMEMAAASGQFFFPKIVLGRTDSNEVEIGQYEGEWENFDILLRTMAINAPIDWIAHTADTFQFLMDKDKPEDAMMWSLIEEGKVVIKDLFEADDPRAVEALTIIKIDRYGFTDSAVIAYDWSDSGKVIWSQVITDAQPIEGKYIESMRKAIQLSLAMV